MRQLLKILAGLILAAIWAAMILTGIELVTGCSGLWFTDGAAAPSSQPAQTASAPRFHEQPRQWAIKPKNLSYDEKYRLFSNYEDEILESFDPGSYKELLQYILYLEQEAKR